MQDLTSEARSPLPDINSFIAWSRKQNAEVLRPRLSAYVNAGIIAHTDQEFIIKKLLGHLGANAFDAIWMRHQTGQVDYSYILTFSIVLTNEGTFRVVVEDNGTGIPEGDVDKILSESFSTKKAVARERPNQSVPSIFGGGGVALHQKICQGLARGQIRSLVYETRDEYANTHRLAFHYNRKLYKAIELGIDKASQGTRVIVEVVTRRHDQEREGDEIVYKAIWPPASVGAPPGA